MVDWIEFTEGVVAESWTRSIVARSISTRDVPGVALTDQFSLDLQFIGGDAYKQNVAAVADDCWTKADDAEEDVFIVGTPSKTVGQESKGIMLEERMNEMVLEIDNLLNTAMLVFKLPIDHWLFVRNLQWPILSSLQWAFICAQISRKWLHHLGNCFSAWSAEEPVTKPTSSGVKLCLLLAANLRFGVHFPVSRWSGPHLVTAAESWFYPGYMCGFTHHFCFRCSACRNRGKNGRRRSRRPLHWQRDWESATLETGCSYQKTGTICWESQQWLFASDYKLNRCLGLINRVFIDGVRSFWMSTILVLFVICSTLENFVSPF